MSSAVLCMAKALQFEMEALPQRDRVALPLPPGNPSTLAAFFSVKQPRVIACATLSFCGQECGRH